MKSCLFQGDGLAVRQRVCREVGPRVLLNVCVQDMDFARPDVMHQLCLEIVAGGLQ